ncbi:hypothetical protein Q2K19_12050 [Micromonospora soli]|uniref:hypothetical protein n=1 Tax=Micromonospora sp. NBRC 110009 TaxID=3061627 RepID=UPI002673D5C2|nr:hypothetical protein [Micromonospora sp. NBRC 110009]WKU01145.1 hypothetical protein Q2K19_12050 [Micromonospora sp. NBRC 110009]
MQEQPPSDPPRREPAASARRSRSTKPTFTPPPTPEPPVEADAGSGTAPRARRARVAPTVLFQPPDPAQAAPAADRTPEPPAAAPRPRPPAETAAAEPPARRADPQAADTGPADPLAEETPKPAHRAPAAATNTKTTPTKKAASTKAATAKKAAPAEAATPIEPATAAKKATAGKAATAGAEAPEEPPAAARTRRVTKTTKAAPARKTAATRKTVAAEPPTAGQPDAPQPPAALSTETATGPDTPQTTRAAQPVIIASASQVIAESGRTPGEGWRAVGARLLDHPGFAPELLAVAAVDTLGPRAEDWVRRARGAYPAADADGLARLVTRRFVRLAGAGGALAAGAGLLAPVAELTAVLWTQANLVLHLAAVHGRDPGHPDRVPELLVLTQVHPDVGTARAALDAVRSAGAPAAGPWPRAAEAAWRLATPLAAQAGGWLGLRLVSRLLPGAALLTAAAGDAAATERLAARAVVLYRPGRAGQSQPNQDRGRSA